MLTPKESSMDNGGYSFSLASQAECGLVYDAMQAENLLHTVIYDGALSRKAFSALLQSGIALLIRRQGVLLAVAWLLDMRGATACLHFCFFRAGRPEAVQAGRQCLRHIFSACALQSLYGITPKVYRAAVRYAVNVGGKILGEVSGACAMHHRGGRVVPAVISTFNRKEYV